MLCKYCGNPVGLGGPYRDANAHTLCIREQPYDLVVDIGKFHLKVHTELLTKRELSRFMSKLSQLTK